MSDAKLTKRALATAMKELMMERPFSEITVADVCGRCGLNRKSLYYHFEDKYALVNWVMYTELIEPLEARGHTDFWELLTQITEHMYANRMFYYHAFQINSGPHVDSSFWSYFASYLQPYILVTVENFLKKSQFFTVKEREDSYAEFLSDAYVYSLMKWIIHYPQCTPEKYVDLFKVD